MTSATLRSHRGAGGTNRRAMSGSPFSRSGVQGYRRCCRRISWRVVQAGAVALEARQDVKVASSIRHHRRDVQLELLEQAGPDDLPQQGPAAGNGHVLAAGRLPRHHDGLLDAAGHEREGRAALALQGLAGPIRRGPSFSVWLASSPGSSCGSGWVSWSCGSSDERRRLSRRLYPVGTVPRRCRRAGAAARPVGCEERAVRVAARSLAWLL